MTNVIHHKHPRLNGRWAPQDPATFAARYWALVDKNGPVPEHRPDLGPCWPWKGQLTKGHGWLPWVAKYRGAHRFGYELANGPVPQGFELDHLCRNRACQNPGHMEPVTSRENTLRGEGITARHARATHCKNGHPKIPANIVIRVSRGYRYKRCKICAREYDRARAAVSRSAGE